VFSARLLHVAHSALHKSLKTMTVKRGTLVGREPVAPKLRLVAVNDSPARTARRAGLRVVVSDGVDWAAVRKAADESWARYEARLPEWERRKRHAS